MQMINNGEELNQVIQQLQQIDIYQTKNNIELNTSQEIINMKNRLKEIDIYEGENDLEQCDETRNIIRQKLIIDFLLWFKDNICVELLNKILEKNCSKPNPQKLGYSRQFRYLHHSNGILQIQYHHFQRFTYFWCPYTKTIVTQPHRATHRNKIQKHITNKFISNWFNKMVDNRPQIIIDKGLGLDEDCPICCEELFENTTTTTQCNHKFCRDCIMKWTLCSHTPTVAKCPICRTRLNL